MIGGQSGSAPDWRTPGHAGRGGCPPERHRSLTTPAPPEPQARTWRSRARSRSARSRPAAPAGHRRHDTATGGAHRHLGLRQSVAITRWRTSASSASTTCPGAAARADPAGRAQPASPPGDCRRRAHRQLAALLLPMIDTLRRGHAGADDLPGLAHRDAGARFSETRRRHPLRAIRRGRQPGRPVALGAGRGDRARARDASAPARGQHRDRHQRPARPTQLRSWIRSSSARRTRR